MVLSDRDILKRLKKKSIIVTPPIDKKTQLSSCSIDLRLYHEFYTFEYSKLAFLDPYNKNQEIPMHKIVVKKNESFILQPNAFVLASTIEYIELPDDIVGRLEGRSSIGRLGVVIHSTAPMIHPGWRGQLTLELGNIGLMPVAVYPGMRICSLTFELLSTPCDKPYYKQEDKKYIGQSGPTMSKITKEFRV